MWTVRLGVPGVLTVCLDISRAISLGLKVFSRENQHGVGFFFNHPRKIRASRKKKNPHSKFYLLGRFIEFGRIRAGVGSFFWGQASFEN